MGDELDLDVHFELPVTEYRRSPAQLRLHVNYRVTNAMELGLLMPVPRKLGPSEAKALWRWIDALGKKFAKD